MQTNQWPGYPSIDQTSPLAARAIRPAKQAIFPNNEQYGDLPYRKDSGGIKI